MVTDPIRWSSLTQHLTARAYKCDGPDGAFRGNFLECDGSLLHEFEPKVMQIAIEHQMSGEVTGTDTSTASVVVYALHAEIFEADKVDDGDFVSIFGIDANYQDKTLGVEDDDDGTTKDCAASLFRRCYCPVTGLDITFTIDGENSGKEETATDDEGYAVQAMSMSRGFTLNMAGPNGHRFNIWNVTDEQAPHRLLPTASTELSYHFDKLTAGIVLALVDVEVGTMFASVLGGTKAQSKFISGQRVIVEREECQFHRETVVVQGSMFEILPATDFIVSIPVEDPEDADTPVNCRDLELPWNGETPCRVPTPQFRSTKPDYRPCAADFDEASFVGDIEFIDEFFAKAAPERRIFDAMDFSQAYDGNAAGEVPNQPIFTYTAPFCLDRVDIGPLEGEALEPLVAGGTPRQIVDEVNSEANGDVVLKDWTTNRIPEALFLRPPEPQEGPQVFGHTHADARGIFNTDDIVEIRFRLIEVYPADDDKFECALWPWIADDDEVCGLKYVPGVADSRKTQTPDPVADFPILISYLDGISGRDYVSDAGPYDPNGFNITTLGTGTANPFAPFTVDFEVTFDRAIDGSFIFFDRSAILLGTIEEDVPQMFPVMTSPSFVFGIIRDPPGGTSKTTLAEGTSFKTSMSIAGMQTSALTRSHSLSYTQGLGASIDFIIAPMGVGGLNPGTKMDYNQGVTWSGTGPSVTAQRGSSQAWDLEFTFDFAVSTSAEPWLAGEPSYQCSSCLACFVIIHSFRSDIILGGGIDIRVSNGIAVRVAQDPDNAPGQLTIEGTPINVWLPEKMSTFLLTAFEIEMTIERLAQQRERELADEDVKEMLGIDLDNPEEADVNGLLRELCLKSQETVPPVCVMNNGIQTWQKVLNNYRNAKVNQRTLMEAAILMYHGVRLVYDDVANARTKPMGEAYTDFRVDMSRGKDFDEFLTEGLTDLKNTERWALLASITGLSDDPKNVFTTAGFLLHAGVSAAVNPAKVIGQALLFRLLLIAFKGLGFALNEMKTRPSMVKAYAGVVDVVMNQARNCAGDPERFVIGDDFCKVQAQLEDITKTSTRLLMNLCDRISGIPSVDMMCTTNDLKTFGLGGADPVLSKDFNVMDFLKDDTKIVTFSGGGAEMSLEMTLEQTQTLGQSASYETESDSSYDDFRDLCFSAFSRARERRRLGESLRNNITVAPRRRLAEKSGEAKTTPNPCADRRRSLITNTFAEVQSETGSIGVSLGRDQSRDSGHKHTVTIELGDGDAYDFFAVKITDDVAYGTPIYQTMGGFSSCPGETVTTSADIKVWNFDPSLDFISYF